MIISLAFSLSGKNLGVTLNQDQSLNLHIEKVNIRTPFPLQRLGAYWFRKKELGLAFVTSWLGYCNSLFVVLEDSIWPRMMWIVLIGIIIINHISPIMAPCHWLPIKCRIIFKILLLTYKVLRSGIAHVWPPHCSFITSAQKWIMLYIDLIKKMNRKISQLTGLRGCET